MKHGVEVLIESITPQCHAGKKIGSTAVGQGTATDSPGSALQSNKPNAEKRVTEQSDERLTRKSARSEAYSLILAEMILTKLCRVQPKGKHAHGANTGKAQ